MIKRVLKRLFSLIGLRVTRTGTGILGSINKPVTSTEDQFKFSPSEEDKFKWIQNMNIKTVIDVGAHAGESAYRIWLLRLYVAT